MHKEALSRTAPRNVANAVVLKEGDIFFIADQSGAIPEGNLDGFGLYCHDCRFLDGYEMELSGTKPNMLVAVPDQRGMAEFELTNETIGSEKGPHIRAQTFGIFIQRAIDGGNAAVHDAITIQNYDLQPHELTVTLRFQSAFEDVFEIRGLHPKTMGRERKPQWHDGVLRFLYDGADSITRGLEVHLEPEAQAIERGGVFHLRLKPHEVSQIRVCLQITESGRSRIVQKRIKAEPQPIADGLHRSSREWLAKYAEVESDNYLLNQCIQRSLLDLRVLRSSMHDLNYFSAGLPWYGTLFGRDSIVAALQTLAFEPQIAEETIRLLAKYQAEKTDEWRDAQPGKILHELRVGELAHLNEIPQTPYYGSVDATPLFLILLGEHGKWVGTVDLFRDMRPHVESALRWIDSHGDGEGGYLAYEMKSRKGLGNQGWKDSQDSISNADGSLAEPPIALVEVQGYVYLAKLTIADLYERSGDPARADELRQQAQALKTGFNRDFWSDSLKFYAIARQKDGRPAQIVSSNPGQALWTGIINEKRAAAVVGHLTAPEMFSGWGIRTLSENEKRYNPIGYHLGTVWPHDNSIVAAGFCRYGFHEDAAHVMDGLLQASQYFELYRLPELFGGFSQHEFRFPVRYPVACHPQAWASGSVPFLLTRLLGLVPNAFEHHLHVIHPVLPFSTNELEFRKIRVGTGSVDLRFRRTDGPYAAVDVIERSGVDVEVETGPERKAA